MAKNAEISMYLATKFMARYFHVSCNEAHESHRKRKKNGFKIWMEISTDNFLCLKCRWKFPPTFFCHSQNVAGNFHRHFLSAKMSLEISTDIFLSAKMSLEISIDIFLSAKMSLEISIDIFLSAKMSLETSTDFFFYQ